MNELFFKGGFAYLILQGIAVNLRGLFRQRTLETHLARCLNEEITASAEYAESFVKSLDEMVGKNRGKPHEQRSFIPSYPPPIDHIYSKHADEVLRVLAKSSGGDHLYVFYKTMNSYRDLLNVHREYFLTPHSMRFGNDPHERLKLMAEASGVNRAHEIAGPTLQALQRIEEGGLGWRLLRSRWVYYPVRILLIVFLVLLPEREAL